MKSRIVFSSILLVFAASLPITAISQENQKSSPAADTQQSQAPDENAPQTQEPKIKHPGGKDDVNAIGTRKLGGMDWYSWDKEIQIGNALAKQFEQNAKMVEDPLTNEYVNRIGQNLVRNSDVKIPVTIKILDSDEPNAMTLPGGHLYVNSGLIMAADEEDELAGVMAHEIGHIAARHGTRGATRAELMNILGTVGSIFIPGGALGAVVRQGIGAGLPMAMFKFSRAFEVEADYLGIQYMYKAGYDPGAMITFFEKLSALEKRSPGTLDRLFATHPQNPDRARKSQEEIGAILPSRDQYIVTTSEFDDIKARMTALHNGHKMQEQKDPTKPTLRRTPGAASPDGKDDDRPVLKKRG